MLFPAEAHGFPGELPRSPQKAIKRDSTRLFKASLSSEMKCRDTPRLSTIFKTVSVLRRGGKGRGEQTEACRSMSDHENEKNTSNSTWLRKRLGGGETQQSHAFDPCTADLLWRENSSLGVAKHR